MLFLPPLFFQTLGVFLQTLRRLPVKRDQNVLRGSPFQHLPDFLCGVIFIIFHGCTASLYEQSPLLLLCGKSLFQLLYCPLFFELPQRIACAELVDSPAVYI